MTPLRTVTYSAPLPTTGRETIACEHPKERALYRLYDAAGRLLYVGITWNPVRRWEKHKRLKSWWSEVARAVVEVYPNEGQALDAEVAAIRSEQPIHNVRSAGR